MTEPPRINFFVNKRKNYLQSRPLHKQLPTEDYLLSRVHILPHFSQMTQGGLNFDELMGEIEKKKKVKENQRITAARDSSRGEDERLNRNRSW